MEMPKGWQKLANEFSPERLANAMQLMKEMAECLDIENDNHKNDYYRYMHWRSVLKKFKEWE